LLKDLSEVLVGLWTAPYATSLAHTELESTKGEEYGVKGCILEFFVCCLVLASAYSPLLHIRVNDERR
jgi:hypothetical protein